MTVALSPAADTASWMVAYGFCDVPFESPPAYPSCTQNVCAAADLATEMYDDAGVRIPTRPSSHFGNQRVENGASPPFPVKYMASFEYAPGASFTSNISGYLLEYA